jgi:hypothetical protein
MFPNARPETDFKGLTICAKKAPPVAIDERGQEGASHTDEGGSICCKRIRQENATCAMVSAGRTSIRNETVKRETILLVQGIHHGYVKGRTGPE